jgi:hypothetical protein
MLRSLIASLVLFAVVGLWPATAAALPPTYACSGAALDKPVCGSGKQRGWYFDTRTMDMHLVGPAGDLFELSYSGSTLTFSSSAGSKFAFAEDFDLTGDLGLIGDMTLTGALGLTGDLTQTGDINLTGDVTQTGDIDLTGNLTVSGVIAGSAQDGAMGVLSGGAETIDVAAVDHVVTTFVTSASSNVGWTFAANDTGPISAMTTSGGGSAVNCADTGHGLVTGDVVNITDALTGGNGAYNAVHVITRVDDDNFTIPITYNADESGTNWKRGDRLIADVGSAGDYMILFSATTSMAGTNTHMTGKIYINEVAQTAEFLIFERFHSNNDTGVVSMTGHIEIADGDEVFLTIQNQDDATDATIKHGSFCIDRS